MHEKTAETPLWPAATVILLKEPKIGGLEVFLMKRPLTTKFMPGAHVFPGGRVDEEDKISQPGLSREGGHPSSDFYLAAIRECHEECGITISSIQDLIPFSWWITPKIEKRRYDTRFFVTKVSVDVETKMNPGEALEGLWMSAQKALSHSLDGKMKVAPPTRACLEVIAMADNYKHLLDIKPDPHIPIEPHFMETDGEMILTLPGDPLHPQQHLEQPYKRTRFVRKLGEKMFV